MRQVGEDVSEVLDYIPGRFEIIRHIRPAFSCRVCESMVQMPMPSLPIERGRPSAGLLAHILVSKYCDHTPLYRQAGIYAREGVDLDRAVMANWVGKSVWIAAPLIEAIGDHVMAAAALHGDDTPVPVLAPGAGKTKTGRLWVYLRDERPHAGPAPVIYRYSPDRKGEHPQRHLARFRGFLHADGYAGFGPLYQSGGDGKPASVTEIACWAHVRRKFHDLHLTGSPLAKEALDRIGRLFDIERAAQGLPPDMRRRIRQSRTVPLIEELADFLDATLPKLSGKSELAVAIRYALCPVALAGADRVSQPRSPRNLEQCRRTRHPAPGPRQKELDVRRIGYRWRAGRRGIHADRDRETQWPRPRSLPARCPRPHCRPPDQPHRRIAALEHRPRPSARCCLIRFPQAPSP
jgi:transposase